MSFQAYLDTVKSTTGMDPADFRAAAEQKGLLADGVKTGEIVAWLAADYGLGRGHAMAIVATFKPTRAADKSAQTGADPVDAHFTGAKAHWRAAFDRIVGTAGEFGPVSLGTTNSYISLLKGRAKFAVVAVTGERLDVGIKLKGAEPSDRFEASGSWNSMVTHRVRITDPAQIDDELVDWLRRAYEAA
jgi:hypothetical protein